IIVTGRTSDNVYSRLLDDFLCTLPGVGQAAAVGVPDPELSEAVHVFLVPRDGADLDLPAIRGQVVRELGDLYEPKAFTVMASLPLTTVGKVDKKALRTAHVLAQAARSEASPGGTPACPPPPARTPPAAVAPGRRRGHSRLWNAMIRSPGCVRPSL